MTILQFPGAPPPPTEEEPTIIHPPPPQAVVQVINEFAEKVARGDLVAIGIVGVQRDGSSCLNSAASMGSIQLLLAASVLLESVIRSRILGSMLSRDPQEGDASDD